MYIGNIITKSPIKGLKLFNIVDNKENVKIGIPTLIIGWELTKHLLGDNKPSILEKKINENLFWTFSKRERRSDYEDDIECFKNTCVKRIETTNNYNFVNIILENKGKIKKIIAKLKSSVKHYIYIKNNSFCYIYDGLETIGFDLNMVDYISINRKKIYRILYGNNNEIFFDITKIPKEFTKHNDRIIPQIYKLTKENGTTN